VASEGEIWEKGRNKESIANREKSPPKKKGGGYRGKVLGGFAMETWKKKITHYA